MASDIQRVLMTGDVVGGVWTNAIDLARALAAHEVRVTLATMGPLPTRDQLVAATSVRNLELALSEFKLEWMDDPWRDVAAAGKWLLDLERVVEPDVVHLNGYAHGSLPWQAPAVVVGHSCLLCRTEAVPGVIPGAHLDAYRKAVTPGVRAAACVAAPSVAMLGSLRRHFGPLPCTRVVPSGRSRQRLRPERKEPFVFSAGRLWDSAENIDALASIASQVPWPVAVASAASPWNGHQMPTLPGVHYLGVLPEEQLAGWLARAPILALPTRYEPFGTLPLEAALSRCALVLGDTPSLREVWGDAADYVDPDDPEALRQAIVRLIASPSLLEARARDARERAGAYTPERMAEGYLDAYRAASQRENCRRAS
jgi:glycosyltransferase involved in cell wall biosynthesis